MDEIAITKNNLPRVVIIGAGFAGLNLVKKLEHKPVQIILIDQCLRTSRRLAMIVMTGQIFNPVPSCWVS